MGWSRRVPPGAEPKIRRRELGVRQQRGRQGKRVRVLHGQLLWRGAGQNAQPMHRGGSRLLQRWTQGSGRGHRDRCPQASTRDVVQSTGTVCNSSGVRRWHKRPRSCHGQRVSIAQRSAPSPVHEHRARSASARFRASVCRLISRGAQWSRGDPMGACALDSRITRAR
jgi:hypothetical protein